MNSKLFVVALLGVATMAMTSCSSDEPYATEVLQKGLEMTDATFAPVVHTSSEITNIASGTAMVKGVLESEGSSKLRLKGFVYSDTDMLPTLKDQRANILSTAFEKQLTGLKDGVEYYVRAYAVNQTDTAYGGTIKLITSCKPSEVITLPVVNRVKLGAIVCGQFKQKGEMKEYGVCLSLKENPTIADTREKAPDLDKTDCFGVFFDNLKPKTMYHVRSYAIQSDGVVVYGNDRIFQTTGGGKVRWWWVYDERAIVFGCKDAITQAMDSAMYYYNNYSNLVKDITVRCHEGIPTAECSWNGDMGFGTNSRYHWVGTAQHEVSHAMGVGTSGQWNNFFTNGIWNKPRAVQALRVMMMDMSQEVRLSGVHFWNGGINQKEEVTNGTANSYGVVIKNARMLKLNAIVLNAMREDGL